MNALIHKKNTHYHSCIAVIGHPYCDISIAGMIYCAALQSCKDTD